MMAALFFCSHWRDAASVGAFMCGLVYVFEVVFDVAEA